MIQDKGPNIVSEKAVIEILAAIFDNVAYMDPGTVRHNIELACVDGMSKTDRSIPVDLANNLINNFAFIYAGLIVNADFRETIKEAVSVEIALDSKTEEFVKQIRGDMQNSKARYSKNVFVMNFGVYNDAVFKKLTTKIFDSFAKLKQFNAVIDSFCEDLTEEDKIAIGFCISNFMYLIRAFSQNYLITNYVNTVVRSVQYQIDA